MTPNWVTAAARAMLESHGFVQKKYRTNIHDATLQLAKAMEKERLKQTTKEALENAEEILDAAPSLTPKEQDALTAIKDATKIAAIL
jgi:hypothetical protein